MSAGALRAIEIVGLVVAVIGGIYWYSTPRDVIVGPIIVVALGLAIAGIGEFLMRKLSSQEAEELAARLRAERENEER